MNHRGSRDRSLEDRDARVGSILGGFFLILSMPVLVGVFFTEKSIDGWINAASGLVLALVGGAFLWRGWYLRRRAKDKVP